MAKEQVAEKQEGNAPVGALETVLDLQEQIRKTRAEAAAVDKKIAETEGKMAEVRKLAPKPPDWIDSERDALLASVAMGEKPGAALQGFVGRANAATKAYEEKLAAFEAEIEPIEDVLRALRRRSANLHTEVERLADLHREARKEFLLGEFGALKEEYIEKARDLWELHLRVGGLQSVQFPFTKENLVNQLYEDFRITAVFPGSAGLGWKDDGGWVIGDPYGQMFGFRGSADYRIRTGVAETKERARLGEIGVVLDEEVR
jgi:hypothetical protein